MRSSMPRATRTIETVDITDSASSETDRMWRRIDPKLYYTVKQATEEAHS